MELLQLIREAKYPDRMGIEIPESAKIVLFQEEKLKSYYNELSWASSEYEAAYWPGVFQADPGQIEYQFRYQD